MDTDTESQQASGRSIFWALTAIIINAMLQSSFTGYVVSNHNFEGSLWPHRSSPLVCLYDMAMEIWFMVESPRRHNTSASNHETRSNATGAVMRLAVFILGVLPQAVKLFTMRGIPITQTLAAIFLVSSLVNMARSLRRSDSQQVFLCFIDGLKTRKKFREGELDLGLLWMSHGASMFAMWWFIADRVSICVSENVKNGVGWTANILAMIITTYVLQHVAFMLIGCKPPIPRYPVILMLFMSDFLAVPGVLQSLEERRRRKNRFQFTSSLLLTAAIVSYSVAYVLYAVAKRLIGETGNVHLAVDAPSSASATADEGNDPAQQTGIINSISHASELSEDPASVPRTDDIVATYPPSSDEAIQPSSSSSTENVESEAPFDDIANMGGEGTTEGCGEVDSSESSNAVATSEATKKEEDLSIGGRVFVAIVCSIVFPPLLLALYSGAWELDRDNKNENAVEQKAAEQGEANSNGARTDERSLWQKLRTAAEILTWKDVRAKVIEAFQWPIRFVLRLILTLLYRLALAVASLYWYTFNWTRNKVLSNSRDILITAVGIMNFATAVVYYLCLFDGAGTVSPGWNSILG